MKNFLEKGLDYKPPTNSCKFYVSVGQEKQDLNKSDEDFSFEKSKPELLDGEIIITEGNRVLFFPNVADKTKGLLGNLYVTNFRFLFDAYEDSSNEAESLHQRNLLVGKHGACLSNIESLFQLLGEKKRKLFQDSQLTDKIKGLQIICKTMKVFTFNFDQSPITQCKNIAKTLLHHAFPGRHQLLFAYDYRNSKVKPGKQVNGVLMFSEQKEWENELVRTCIVPGSNWRISSENQRFQMSTSLPKWLIVPHSVLDCDFVTASQSFRCSRPPIWTWSSPNGAALVRMADLLPTISDRTQENRMLENVRKCHPSLKGPCIKYLDKELPSVNELSQSYSKLKELCMPDSHRQFKEQDSHLYSLLENTKWLQNVSTCLKVVVDAALEIERGTTVVLQELDGRDMSAVISSLVQLVLDPHTRSILGFQSLVQKEWISLGHPFCKRLGHVRTNISEQSPVFLFFLDCVWQLQNQFPSSFEFTETYLTTLWDSVHISIFDTFLFDSEKDRFDAYTSTTERLEPRSVWNWNLQFSDRDIELFINPLYQLWKINKYCESDGESRKDSILIPEPSLPCLDLWMQCYFRWLPLLSIKSGGHPQIDLVHRQLLRDIQSLLCDVRGNCKRSLDSCGNQNGGNNNGACANGGKENSLNYSIGGKSGSSNSSNSSNNQDCGDFSRWSLSNVRFCGREIDTLIKNKGVIDNFFPFALSSTPLNSSTIVNSSNLSDCDTQSVLNLTNE